MPSPANKLVSVIIPFLNGPQWLRTAIESVVTQNYAYWEAILIDDGSGPEASDIAKEYSTKFRDKIIYTDHPGHINKGVTASRNLGISLSKGEFIAFLDSDDCWLPQKLTHQLELFQQYPLAAMICEASRFWYSWDDAAKEDVVTDIGAAPGLYHPRALMKILYPLGQGAPPCPTGIIIRKDAFNRSGGFEEIFCGEYQLYEDQAFLSKVYLREHIYISNTPNNLYRKRAGSLTGSGDDERHYKKVRLFFLEWLSGYILQQQVTDDAITTLINEACLLLM